MIEKLPQRNQTLVPFRFQRYYEVINDKVRIFGPCEITGHDFEMIVPTKDFFNYLLNNVHIGAALKDTPKEEREFLITGISPQGWKILWNVSDDEDLDNNTDNQP